MRPPQGGRFPVPADPWPCLVVGLLVALLLALSAPMAMPWGFDQLLDPAALRAAPVKSLLLLHGQPPLLNAVAALCLAAEGAGWGDAAAWASVLFCALAAASCAMTFDLGRRLGGGRRTAWAAVLLVVLAPGFWHFGRLLFTPFLLQTALLAVLFFSARLLHAGRGRDILGFVLALAACSLAHALYHPLWALALAAAVLSAAKISRPRGAAALAGLALLLALWPAKNLRIFGRFVMHGWTGHALSRFWVPDERHPLEAFLRSGGVDEGITARARSLEDRLAVPDEARVLSSPCKASTGRANWNHLLLLEESPRLARAGLGERLRHPLLWTGRTGAHVLAWCRPSWVHPYEGVSLLRPGLLRRWGQLLERVLFFDLAAGRLPGGRPLPLFALLFPALALAGRAGRKKEQAPSTGSLVLLAWILVLWTLLGPALTDGAEGNRIGYGVAPILALLVVHAVSTGFGALRGGGSADTLSAPGR